MGGVGARNRRALRPANATRLDAGTGSGSVEFVELDAGDYGLVERRGKLGPARHARRMEAGLLNALELAEAPLPGDEAEQHVVVT